MTASIIAAMDLNGLIGAGLSMPWHLPDDLRRFRALTWGKPVVMGRKTFQSLGKPLPGRTNIVLSHQPLFEARGSFVCNSLIEAIRLGLHHLDKDEDEVMIIGGGNVFRQAIQYSQTFYRTTVHGTFSGDTFFPAKDITPNEWNVVHRTHIPADERNKFAHTYEILKRKHRVTIDSIGQPARAACG